jgi:hypothetical protein
MSRFTQLHEFHHILMQDRKFHHFIILTIIMPVTHDSVGRRENALGISRELKLKNPRTLDVFSPISARPRLMAVAKQLFKSRCA